jgi:hypothetical protein
MKIDWLKPLVGRPGPFVTVYLDVTSADPAGDREVESRWRAVRRSLEQQGAPAAVLSRFDAVLERPVRRGHPVGRVLIGDAGTILVDRILRTPPAVDQGVFGRAPALLQAARSADEAVDYVKVVVDRQGADLFWPLAGGSEVVDGSHDVINKASSTGVGRARLESRAEDSWERNAEVVAADLERQVRERKPEVVVLTGDVRAVPLVRSALSRPVAELVIEVPGGGRAGGINEGAFAAKVAEALDAFRIERSRGLLDRFRENQGREDGAVTSTDDVVAVLQRGQVAELVLGEELADDSPDGGPTLWIGPEPMHIAATAEDLAELGVTSGTEELPAVVALVRAALGQDAGVTFAPEGSVDLIEGVGAVLRWSDTGTPREVAATMSGDDKRLRGEIV